MTSATFNLGTVKKILDTPIVDFDSEPNDMVMSPPITLNGSTPIQFVPFAVYGRYFDFIDLMMDDIGTATKVEIGNNVTGRWPIKWYGSTDYYSLPFKSAPYDLYDWYVRETNAGAIHAKVAFVGCKHKGGILERRS
jgi:hypothetical protein